MKRTSSNRRYGQKTVSGFGISFAISACVIGSVFLLPLTCLSAVTTTYEYDPLNRLSVAAYGTSFTETYAYDPTGNRTSLAVSTGEGLLKQQQLTEDLGTPKGSQAMKTASLSPTSPLASQSALTEYSLKGTRSDTPLSTTPFQDIIWKDTITGDYALWRMEGTAIKETISLPLDPGPDFKMSVTGDFNGDGKTDILFRNTKTGENRIWCMDQEKVTESHDIDTVKDLNWSITGAGTFSEGRK